MDTWQRRHPAVAVPFAVVRKFLDDRASSQAALVAYYAFFSLFPLLLVFVSVLGFVLDDNPSLRDDIVDSVVGRIPVLGAQVASEVHPLTGSTLALVIGLAGALWAGLGVTTALGRAFEEIWDVQRVEQRSGLRERARGFLVLVVLGVALTASVLLTNRAVVAAGAPGAERVATVAITLAINALMFLLTFALLTDGPVRVRELLPGVALAVVGAVLLQSAGAWYVDHAIEQATATYGVFAVVIGLLSWFWLGAHLLLMAAELNVVLHRRLWPRALGGALGPADRDALRLAGEAARQDRRQEIQVTFTDGEG